MKMDHQTQRSFDLTSDGIEFFAKAVKKIFIKEKKTGFIFIHSPWAFEDYSEILLEFRKKLDTYNGTFISVGVTEVPEVTAFFSSRRINISHVPAIVEYYNGKCVGVHEGLAQFNAYLKYGDIINDRYPRIAQKSTGSIKKSRNKDKGSNTKSERSRSQV